MTLDEIRELTETAPVGSHPVGRRIRVAVVYGGRSSEHGVSVVSAGSVLAALDSQKYDVLPVGITPSGQWMLTDASPESWFHITSSIPRRRAIRRMVAALSPNGGRKRITFHPRKASFVKRRLKGKLGETIGQPSVSGI